MKERRKTLKVDDEGHERQAEEDENGVDRKRKTTID